MVYQQVTNSYRIQLSQATLKVNSYTSYDYAVTFPIRPFIFFNPGRISH